MTATNAIASFLTQFEIEILVVIAVAILEAITKIPRRYVKYVYYRLSGKPFRIEVAFHRTYKGTMDSAFNSEIVRILFEQSDSNVLRKEVLQPHFLSIWSEKLGMTVSASLEEEIENEENYSEQTAILGYNIVIKHDAEMRGFNGVNDVHEFVTLATKLERIIAEQCFQESNVEPNYVVCDVKDYISKPISMHLTDEKRSAEISIHDKVLTIKSSEPHDLPKLLSHYLIRFSA